MRKNIYVLLLSSVALFILTGMRNEHNIYFGHLHAHTSFSDGTGTPEEAFRHAKEVAGLDFYGLSDHSEYFDERDFSPDNPSFINLQKYNNASAMWQAGKKAAARATIDGEFIALYGYEMTWAGGAPGHINTFFTDGFVSVNNVRLNEKQDDKGLRAYYNLLKRTPGSVSMFNHPGTFFGNFNDFNYIDHIIAQRITLLEVSNGDGDISDEGRSYFRSFWQYNLALDKGWQVAPVMSQDNHNGLWGDANSLRTAILAPALTATDLQQALLERRVYASETEGVEIFYSANGFLLGSVVNELPADIHFIAKIRNRNTDNRIVDVSVITNGGEKILTDEPGTTHAFYNKKLYKPEPGYYYLRVAIDTPQGLRYAFTAPVWFLEK